MAVVAAEEEEEAAVGDEVVVEVVVEAAAEATRLKLLFQGYQCNTKHHKPQSQQQPMERSSQRSSQN